MQLQKPQFLHFFISPFLYSFISSFRSFEDSQFPTFKGSEISRFQDSKVLRLQDFKILSFRSFRVFNFKVPKFHSCIILKPNCSLFPKHRNAIFSIVRFFIFRDLQAIMRLEHDLGFPFMHKVIWYIQIEK